MENFQEIEENLQHLLLVEYTVKRLQVIMFSYFFPCSLKNHFCPIVISSFFIWGFDSHAY